MVDDSSFWEDGLESFSLLTRNSKLYKSNFPVAVFCGTCQKWSFTAVWLVLLPRTLQLQLRSNRNAECQFDMEFALLCIHVHACSGLSLFLLSKVDFGKLLPFSDTDHTFCKRSKGSL